MNRSLFLVAVLALAGCSLFRAEPAEAATVTVNWTNPTTNTDDSTIPDTGAGSLQSWRIEYGTCTAGGAFGVRVGEVVRTRPVGGPALTSAVLNLDPQTVCIRAHVTNSYGNESDPSNVRTHVVPAPRPRAPILTSVE